MEGAHIIALYDALHEPTKHSRACIVAYDALSCDGAIDGARFMAITSLCPKARHRFVRWG